MFKRLVYFATIFSITIVMTTAFAEVNAVTPSTNDANRILGWAHVDPQSNDVGTIDLTFISTRSFWSCFEYRTDGDTTQKLSEANHNTQVTDGLYPHVCVNNSSQTETLTAKYYVEVRMVFGAETDERFDWTKFYVLGGFKVRPWIYDPDDTGLVAAAWVGKLGLTDDEGSTHALYLSKVGATAANASAGATLDGVEGIVLTELGFDYRSDGYCGAGAPRFNLYTTAGTYYFVGCVYGQHVTDTPETGWTRVRFSDADAFPADGVTAFPGFGAVTVTGIDIVFDEGPGSIYLDNIDVNGALRGRPGLPK